MYFFDSDCKKVVYGSYLLEKAFAWVCNGLQQAFCNDSYLVNFFFFFQMMQTDKFQIGNFGSPFN